MKRELRYLKHTPKIYVIAYDIVDNRKRYKTAEILKDYGWRVQKSVFECALTIDVLEELLQKLEDVIDPKTDSLIVYRLCEACLKRKKTLGLTVVHIDAEVKIL